MGLDGALADGGVGAARQLEQRGALGTSARRAVAAGPVTAVTGFRTARVDGTPGGPVSLVSVTGEGVADVDEIIGPPTLSP